MAAGIKIFSSLDEAQAAGFTLYEKRPDGYLVRRDDGHAFALALVLFEKDKERDKGREREDAPPAE